mmetsp:Transcript_13243/g.37631  ORF Transcript_13243/g.37631 Transcript_13243/m.37631 type:complete len:334 (-) Transcript_13243:61-1062(-)
MPETLDDIETDGMGFFLTLQQHLAESNAHLCTLLHDEEELRVVAPRRIIQTPARREANPFAVEDHLLFVFQGLQTYVRVAEYFQLELTIVARVESAGNNDVLLLLVQRRRHDGFGGPGKFGLHHNVAGREVREFSLGVLGGEDVEANDIKLRLGLREEYRNVPRPSHSQEKLRIIVAVWAVAAPRRRPPVPLSRAVNVLPLVPRRQRRQADIPHAREANRKPRLLPRVEGTRYDHVRLPRAQSHLRRHRVLVREGCLSHQHLARHHQLAAVGIVRLGYIESNVVSFPPCHLRVLRELNGYDLLLLHVKEQLRVVAPCRMVLTTTSTLPLPLPL